MSGAAPTFVLLIGGTYVLAKYPMWVADVPDAKSTRLCVDA